MARGRRKAKKEAVATRAAEAREAAETERAAANLRAANERRILRRWGNSRGALDRLITLSRELERLHREETKLLNERDDLVAVLRSDGQSWVALSARTRLSRQALMKRAKQTAAAT